jgi:hypothetical protein
MANKVAFNDVRDINKPYFWQEFAPSTFLRIAPLPLTFFENHDLPVIKAFKLNLRNILLHTLSVHLTPKD